MIVDIFKKNSPKYILIKSDKNNNKKIMINLILTMAIFFKGTKNIML